jgi:hypothetical protein
MHAHACPVHALGSDHRFKTKDKKDVDLLSVFVVLSLSVAAIGWRTIIKTRPA